MMTIRKFMSRASFGRAMLALVAMPLLLCAGTAQGAAMTSAHVTYIGVYGTGNVFILLDATVAEPTCPAARVDILSTHPALKTILATAMLAKSTGSTFAVRSSGCLTFTYQGVSYTFPTFDTSTDGYIGVAP